MKRLIDKIRFIKTFPKTKSGANENFKAHMSVASSLVCKDGLKPIHGTPFQTVLFQPYKGKTEENSLRLTFGGNKGGSYIAVECTPYKLTADEWMDACGYMTAIFGGPEVISKTFQLFEVELAIDIPQPMTDFIFVSPRLKQQGLNIPKPDHIKLGSKQGSRWIRIYNKKKHLQEKKGIQVAGQLTRIEFVCRRLPSTLASCLSIPNPFNDIIVVPRSKIPEIKKKHANDYSFGHFAGMVSQGWFGHTAYWNIDDADMRKGILKRLRPYALNLAGSKADWDSWIASELNLLKSKFLPS